MDFHTAFPGFGKYSTNTECKHNCAAAAAFNLKLILFIQFRIIIVLNFMRKRQKYSSGQKWEKIVGYSRAVKVGNRIYVTGTTATDENGNIVAENDAYAQTVQVIKNIEKALNALDATLENVVRTRMFVTNISRWEEYGRAHGEFFALIKPCATMIEVSKLVDLEMLIEIEVEAEM